MIKVWNQSIYFNVNVNETNLFSTEFDKEIQTLLRQNLEVKT